MPDPAPVRVLVADDEPAILELLQTVLSVWGYAAELVPDGEAALSRALEGDHGLLLFDYQMPRMTGLEALRRLRTAGRTVPAILMSGYFSDPIVRESAAVAGIQLLPKPFTLSALRQALLRAAGGEAPRP